MNNSLDAVAVGWTGGWDSSFRVLELVVRYNCKVQPIYVVEPDRRSQSNEIQAMDAIRSWIDNALPERSGLLLPTIYVKTDNIHVSDSDAAKFEYLGSQYHVAKQYYWLSAVGKMYGFQHVEVMFHGNDTDAMWQFIRDHAEVYSYPCGAKTYILRAWDSTDEFQKSMELFQSFAAPTINTGKPEMGDIAKEYGFYEPLLKSWFCHMPYGDEPCGMCRPCRHVIYDGLSQRFPKSALRRYRFWMVLHPVRVLIEEPRGTFTRLGNLGNVAWRQIRRKFKRF